MEEGRVSDTLGKVGRVTWGDCVVTGILSTEKPSDPCEEEKGQWVWAGEATVPDAGLRGKAGGGFQSWNSAIRVETGELIES